MTGDSIVLSGVAKRYGRQSALDDINLSLAAGECLALVGHNGAGKTTLMKLLLGLIRPSAGSLRVLGEDPAGGAAVAARRRIGFLPEAVAFDGGMTGRGVIAFYARLKGVDPGVWRELLDRVGLAEVAEQPIATYSKGMRQRLGLAQALLGAPRILLLDEPTSGLDPALRRSFYRIIRELKAAGTTILLASHALTELEARTDRVAIMNRGRLVACGTLGELRRAAGLPVRIRVELPGAALESIAEGLAGRPVTRVNDHAVLLSCDAGEQVAVLREVVALDLPLDGIEVVPPGLDDLYRHFLEREERP